MRERFEQMISYAANEQECRSAVLERYFGEENPAPCGVCDICLARKRAAKAAAREAGTAPGTALPEAAGDAPGSESALREKLLARLARSPADPHRLAAELACPPERLAEAVGRSGPSQTDASRFSAVPTARTRQNSAPKSRFSENKCINLWEFSPHDHS